MGLGYGNKKELIEVLSNIINIIHQSYNSTLLCINILFWCSGNASAAIEHWGLRTTRPSFGIL